MRCPLCRSAVPARARFCPNCGTALRAAGPDKPAGFPELESEPVFHRQVGPVTTSVTAILSLAFGITAWNILPFLGAVLAIVLGHKARGEIRESGGWMEGDGLALVGLALGYAQLLLLALALLVILGMVAIYGFHVG